MNTPVAFDEIAKYAKRRGWLPIGFREWRVGPWQIRMNGTREQRDGIPPYHALVEHEDVLALMLVSPSGGSIGGWQGAEDAFIAAMQAEQEPMR